MGKKAGYRNRRTNSFAMILDKIGVIEIGRKSIGASRAGILGMETVIQGYL